MDIDDIRKAAGKISFDEILQALEVFYGLREALDTIDIMTLQNLKLRAANR